MSTGWGSVLGHLFAPAMVVAISPFSIIAVLILILHTDRPRPNGVAFLAGRLIALAACTAVFMQAPRMLNRLNRPMSPWLLIAIGGILLVTGLAVWAGRDRITEEPRWLRWLRSIDRITPLGAAAIGLLLVLTNPKMLAANAAAGLLVDNAGLSVAAAGGAVLYYSALASSTVAIPVFAYVAVGARSDAHLTRLKNWLHRRNGLVSAVILIAVAIALLLTGIRQIAA
jgi:hypothetical protein